MLFLLKTCHKFKARRDLESKAERNDSHHPTNATVTISIAVLEERGGELPVHLQVSLATIDQAVERMEKIILLLNKSHNSSRIHLHLSRSKTSHPSKHNPKKRHMDSHGFRGARERYCLKR
ncbi:uncharacterized protein [Malus domestica]|uniref:uncharacterized protein isoform X1 n=1 Tax=Malus domestica TaxID=3750 RepID=UPI0039756B8E